MKIDKIKNVKYFDKKKNALFLTYFIYKNHLNLI